MNRNLVRLNKKTAKKLVKKVLGVSGAALMKEETGNNVDVYHMTMGELDITVENDWYEKNGLFVLIISSVMVRMQLYFRPDTLEEDYDAEEAWEKEKQKNPL